MQRRAFTGLIVSLAGGTILSPLGSNAQEYKEEIGKQANTGLPANLPDNLKQMVSNTVKIDFQDVNTDWDGTIRIEGLLRFSQRGYREGLTYASNWFNYHLKNDAKLDDEAYFNQYDGPRARILRDGPLTFVIYSSVLNLACPVHELYKQTGNKVAKEVCLDVAEAIVHYVARDKYGMMAHDDKNFTNFTIPDTAYYAVRATAIASSLTKGDLSKVYLKQSVYQLDLAINHFFDKDKNLSRLGIFDNKSSTIYWCRSQGWLMWSIAGLLRYIPTSHSYYTKAATTFAALANGVKKYQTKNGGLHVYVDDPSTPEDVTSIAMVIAVVKEGMRKGWLPKEYNDMCDKGWQYIQKSVDADGKVHNAYTGWALTAHQGQKDLMDTKFRGFAVGILMLAADEMTR